jgi:hypothetical protein
LSARQRSLSGVSLSRGLRKRLQERIARLSGHAADFSSVHNLAGVQLSTSAKRILSLGTGFVPTLARDRCTSAKDIHLAVNDLSWRIFWKSVYKLGMDKPCPPFYVRKTAALRKWKPVYPSVRIRLGIQRVERFLLARWVYAYRGYYEQPCSLPREAMASIAALRLSPQIIIRPADKNMGLCIVNRDWYADTCLKHLVFQGFNFDPC